MKNVEPEESALKGLFYAITMPFSAVAWSAADQKMDEDVSLADKVTKYRFGIVSLVVASALILGNVHPEVIDNSAMCLAGIMLIYSGYCAVDAMVTGAIVGRYRNKITEK